MAGYIDRRVGLAPRHFCLSATQGRRARRYWQLADSDDALLPHWALSSAVLHEVVERSDERIEGQTFDWRGGP